MSRKNFLKHIEQLNEEELRDELKVLYSKSKEVKNFYALELGEAKDREKIYDRAKKDIASKYATKSYRRPRRPRIQKINMLLNKLHKSAVFPHEMIDIYLYNSECGIKFMKEYRFESTPLCNSISKSFTKAVEIINLEKMHGKYHGRVNKMLDSVHYIHDIYSDLNYTYCQYFDS